MQILSRRGTHAGQLDRWLGAQVAEQVSRDMRDWYGPPIAVAGVPGAVWACRGGDFRGRIGAGQVGNAIEFGLQRARRILRGFARRQLHQANAGFSSLSDLIAEATAGKRYHYPFQKSGTAGVVGVTSSLWRAGTWPPSGSAPAAPAAGTAYTDASTGGFPFTNPTGGDTQHLVAAYALASVAPNSLLLYDLLYGVAPNMNSSSTQSVTGVPTRYQSSTPGNADYAGGNFLFFQVGGTALAATAHNWTVCQYRNQAGTDTQTLPSLTGNASAIVDRLDHPVGQWFAPLNAGDTGIMDLAQIQLSAAVATGVGWAMIGHPIAILPCPIAGLMCQVDGINTSFNLVRIFDDACLAFLEMNRPATGATNYSGLLCSVAG